MKISKRVHLNKTKFIRKVLINLNLKSDFEIYI